MKKIFLAVLTVLLMLPGFLAMAATADDICLASWASLMAYDDRIGHLSRHELEKRGLSIERFNETTNQADAKCYIIKRPRSAVAPAVTIFAITGTENKRDIKNDLRIATVPFHPGRTGQATDSSVPQVHKGFDDYTTVALHTMTSKGLTIEQSLLQDLQAEPAAPLIITGHSLGGAVATLSAARLADMGVAPDRLSVITFGAPAVGNQAFVDMYKSKFQLERIVVKGDIVNSILPALVRAYAHFPQRTTWKQPVELDRFEHDITGYVDMAMRHYYDSPHVSPAGPVFFPSSGLEAGHVYVAPFTFYLDEDLASERHYMELALRDSLRGRFQDAHFSASESQTMIEACQAALKAHCAYVIFQRYSGRRLRNVENKFAMSLQEEIYDTTGRLIYAQAAITDTNLLTPLLALLYDQVKAEQSREEFIQYGAVS